MPDRSEQIVLEFSVDEGASIESIESLTKANKALREERNKLNLQSTDGKKRAQEINTLLDQNTTKIKTNVSALEQQKINIGNYKSALDNVIPGLSGFLDKTTQGTKAIGGMSTATKLLLGPFALIGLALAAIIKYFTGTEEGADKLAIIMAKVEAVVGVAADRFIQLGKALTEFSWEGIKAAFSGIGEEIEKEVTAATDLAERLDILDDLNLSLNIRLSEQGNIIKNLIIQSKNRSLSEEEASAKLVEAARLEKQLTGERIALRVAELNAIATGIQLRNSEKEAAQQAGETTLEFAKRLAGNNSILLADRQKIAEQLDQYNGLLDNQANIQEKIQNQQDAISDKIAENAKKRADALREEEALLRANARAQSDIQKSIIKGVQREERVDPLIDAFDTQLEGFEEFGSNRLRIEDRIEDESKKRKQKAANEDVDRAEKVADLKIQAERQAASDIGSILGTVGTLFEEKSVEQKFFSSAQALINTYLAATAALASGSEINPIFGIISAAAAIATGLASVAKINGVQFAEGGWTGPGRKHDAVGVVHADEYVTPKWLVHSPQAQPHLSALEIMRQRGYADGGFVVNSVTQPINQQLELSNIFKNMPPMELSVKEVSKVQNRVRVKEQISKR